MAKKTDDEEDLEVSEDAPVKSGGKKKLIIFIAIVVVLLLAIAAGPPARSWASEPTTIGSLTLASFINPAGLEATGGNLLQESAASGAPTVGTPGLNGLGTLLQGNLESSNVNVVQELVSMIETQRAYEMNSKSVETSDQMLSYLTQNL